jgi:glycosyltransferase involved in cell wall biosynthesis
MKIYLLYNSTERPWGGINTFFRNFRREAELCEEVKIVSSAPDADIMLTSGHYSGPGKLLTSTALKNISLGRHPLHPFGFLPGKGKPAIVFRLDGLRMFYTGKRTKADDLLLKNLSLADAVVFQSRHCRNIFESMKVSRPETESTILNGAAESVFYPLNSLPQKIARPIRLLACSWSRDKSKGFEKVAKFAEIDGIEVSHIGRWSATIPPGKVKLLGVKQEKETAEIMRNSHFLLFPSENDACPNIVVEALASGIPVLYHNSGGTPELCGNGQYGIPIPENPAKFADFIKDAEKQYPSLRKNIMKNIESFSFKRCFNEYMEFFRSIIEN